MSTLTNRVSLPLAAIAMLASSLGAQDEPAASRRPPVKMDSARAALLYVSNRPEDHSAPDFAQQIRGKAVTDSIYRARSAGVMDFQKVSYKSAVDGALVGNLLKV